jgi:hypothetical protein
MACVDVSKEEIEKTSAAVAGSALQLPKGDYAQYPDATPLQLFLYYLRFFGGQRRSPEMPFEDF